MNEDSAAGARGGIWIYQGQGEEEETMTTETETETKTLKGEPKWLSRLPEEERAWLRLRDQIGREVAHRIEHHTVLMVEALAEARWTDREIREFLDAHRFRDPEQLEGAAREAALVLGRIAAEVGDEVTRTSIAFSTCEGGWPLVVEACDAKPRTERIKGR